jgi:hypothetical protein
MGSVRAERMHCAACGKWLDAGNVLAGNARCKECRRARYYGEGDPRNGKDLRDA